MKYFFYAVFSLTLFPVFAFANIALPPNDGFFTDAADLVPIEQEEVIENALQSIYKDSGNYLIVLFLNNVGNEAMDAVSQQVQKEWNLSDEHILILFSYRDRKIHIEPGTAFSNLISREIADGIVEKDVLPKIREGQYGTAVIDGIEGILKHLSGEYTAERYTEPTEMGKSVFIVILYAIVGIFALSWLFGTILIHTTSSKYSLAGTMFGPITGVLLLEQYGLWLAIPPFLILGILSDFLVFKMYSSSFVKSGKRKIRRKRR